MTIAKQLKIKEFPFKIKDKNGKEIYEGDILSQRQYDGWFDEVGYDMTNEVLFHTTINDSGYHLAGWRFGQYGIIHNTCEVIGNIFENPELIK